jgi:hypothetical protein
MFFFFDRLGANHMYDIETKIRFIRLRARGMSIREIAGELKISKNTITDWNSLYAEKISDAQREEIDGILLELGVDKMARLRDLARYYNRVKEDLDKEIVPGMYPMLRIKDLRDLMKLHKDFNSEGFLPNLRKPRNDAHLEAGPQEGISGTKLGQE